MSSIRRTSDDRARRLASTAMAIAALAIVGSSASLGCRRAPGPIGARTEGAPRRGGVLHLANSVDLRTIDPAVAFDTETQPWLELLYAGLVDYDEKGKLVGDLAERWETSADGKTYRFFLRHGVKMHDGASFEADDVKRSVERALHPKTSCPGSSFFERIDGYDAYTSGAAAHLDGVIVESPHVVTFRLARPDPAFLSVLALDFLRPVCKSAGDRYDDTFSLHACGAGPFQVDDWQPGRFLRVKRFDAYWDARGTYLDAAELRMNVPTLTQRFQFERGEQDLLGEFERPDRVRYGTDPRWAPYAIERIDAAVYGEFMNTEMRPFDDVRVRRAVAAAINKPHLEKYVEGGSRITGHLFPPAIPGYDPDYQGQTYDLAKARALMAEAGLAYDPATGRGGWPQPIQYYAGDAEGAVRWAALVQYDLAQIGLRIEIKVTSFSQYLAETGRRKTAAMGFTGWNIDYPDPSDFLEPIFSSRAIMDEESQNHAFYRNPKLDALLDRAHDELDPDARLKMYREAERIVVDDAPWAFESYPLRFELTQPYVRDYRAHPIWLLPLRHVWLDEAGRAAKTASLDVRAGEALGALLGPARGPTRGGPRTRGAR
jgi:ABC-type transport system substrate-binding protein